MKEVSERSTRRALVRQLDASDCGAACIATVIRYFGGDVPLERIRELTGTGPSGTTLLGLMSAGPKLGLLIDGFEANVDTLAEIKCPCILHVTGSTGGYHFVVSFGWRDEAFLIADPASGIRRISNSDLRRIWTTGALLTVRQSPSFIRAGERARDKRLWMREAVRDDAGSLMLSVVLGGFVAAFGLSVALFSQVLIDDVLPNRDGLKLIVGLGLVALFLLAQNVFAAARQVVLIRQARSFNNRIIRRFVDSLVHLPFPFFAARRTGDLIARLNDTRRLQRFVTFAVGGVVINVLILIASFAFVVSHSVYLGAWVLGGLALLGICAAVSHGPIVRGQIGVMSAHAANESQYVDSIRGIEAIKATNAERFFAASMRSTFGAFQDAVFRLGRAGVSFNFAAQVAGLFILLGVLGWGAGLVLEGELQIGAFVALIQMTNMLVPAAYAIALSNIDLQEAAVAFDRMYQFSALESEYTNCGSTRADTEIHSLEIRKLSFRFPGRFALLRDVTLVVNRGEIVLLSGRTGSGKSTLLRILLRLFEADAGCIQVNGRDWSDIPTDAWRHAVAIIPQQIQIFSGSLAENICMHPVKGVEGARDFCRSIGLHDVFRTLPHGYATLLGEGGVSLSGGQQRLLGLCRALYRRPQILFVDEPFTGLDRAASSRAIRILRRRKKTMATLIVSHRPEIRRMADRAYVLQNATVRELEPLRNGIRRDRLSR